MIASTPSSATAAAPAAVAPAPASGERYGRIQILRFVAALGVVLYHGSLYLQQKRPDAGVAVRVFDHHFALGVQLFFVISGFVIAHSIERMSVGEFARRRLLRIYPAYWLAVAITLGGKLLLFGTIPGGEDLGRALTLLPFGPLVYPLSVEWSLIYEVFFYGVVALAAAFGWARTRDWLCVLWLLVIVVAALEPQAKPTAFLPTYSQIAFSAFNLPFIAGLVVHRLHLRLPVETRHAYLAAAVALLVGAEFLLRTESKLLLQGMAFGALALWAVLADRHAPMARGSFAVRLGDWSYGLYLMHVPIITLLLSFGIGVVLPPVAQFVLVIVAAVVGASAFGAFEAAFYQRLLRWTRPAVTAR